MILVFPLALSATWEMVPGYTLTVASYESVTVPLGAYDCFRVDYQVTSSMETSFYYSKNVGQVKILGINPTSTITYELTSKNF